jgi:hypothetical protein
LSGGTVKEELQKRVDVVDKAMKKKAEEIKKAKLKAELVRAEAAKKLAEEQKNSKLLIAPQLQPWMKLLQEVQKAIRKIPITTNLPIIMLIQGIRLFILLQAVLLQWNLRVFSTPTEVVPPSSLEVVVPSTPTPVEPSSSTETEVPADSSMIIEDQSQR